MLILEQLKKGKRMFLKKQNKDWPFVDYFKITFEIDDEYLKIAPNSYDCERLERMMKKTGKTRNEILEELWLELSPVLDDFLKKY